MVRRTFTVVLLFLLTELAAADTLSDARGPQFPLKISANRRHLVDQDNRPFLLVGDAAWSLIVQLDRNEVDQYLDARRKLGFNTLLVNLVEHCFADHAPKNHAGAAPFHDADDLSTPNEDYFAFADDVIRNARQRGFCILLTPAYLGYGGGDQGWFAKIKRGGREKLRAYGQFVGKRYRKQPNIIWVMGGDFTPEKKDFWTVDELAAGIREAGAKQWMTFHGSPGRAPAVDFADREWLDLNNTYSYDENLYADTLADYQRKPVRPTFLMESAYENEHNASPQRIRRQAWWAMTTGACGHIYGNNPTWSFNAPNRLFRKNNSWQEELASQGAKDMGHLAQFSTQLPWHELVPEAGNSFLVAGRGKPDSIGYSTAAASRDGRWAVVYIAATAPRKLTLKLNRFAGGVQARWFNPTTGRFIDDTDSPLRNRGEHEFSVPQSDEKQDDWVLLLVSRV